MFCKVVLQRYFQVLSDYSLLFLATQVALHYTPVTVWVKLAQLRGFLCLSRVFSHNYRLTKKSGGINLSISSYFGSSGLYKIHIYKR